MQVPLSKVTTTLSDLGVRFSSIKAECLDADDIELLCLELGVDCERVDMRKQKIKNIKRALFAEEHRKKGGGGSGGKVVVPLPKDEMPPSEVDLHFADTEDLALARMELKDLPIRPPVVSIMGHVDHGKTTLLDLLRRTAKEAEEREGGKGKGGGKGKKKKKKKAKTSNKNSGADDVAGTEAGGITQIITAFTVPVPKKFLEGNDNLASTVCFLDTPGHAAFSAMRENGGNATDIICLVIAADDGVNAQTREVIKIAKQGNQGIMVAVTKIDKTGVDVDEALQRIGLELGVEGLEVESQGGDVQILPVSGITGEGVDSLIESMVLQSEMMELKADPEAAGEAVVIDARLDKGLGVVCDCVVRWGKFDVGDPILSGLYGGKVKIMREAGGTGAMKSAGPSTPVRIVGLRGVPNAGETLVKVSSEAVAKKIADRRLKLHGEKMTRTADRASAKKVHLEVMGGAARIKTRIEAKNLSIQQGKDMEFKYKRRFIPELEDSDRLALEEAFEEGSRAPVIIKADCEGTLQAVKQSLMELEEETDVDVEIDIVHVGIGAVTQSDVFLASEAGGVIFAFGVKGSDNSVEKKADEDDVDILKHDVIYSLLDDARHVLGKFCPVVKEEKVLGKLNVMATFTLSGSAKQRGGVESIAGGKIVDGKVYLEKDVGGNQTMFRVLRGGKVVKEGVEGGTLRKFKDEVGMVEKGDECGLSFEGNYKDFKEGDVIECYVVEEQQVVL
ncbi:hypothetical protein TrRE_jg7517 [Triparma retinervis]|uniref:Tr-type G domain-containing protein n=1 Tax=Triparma retinervis TaxID=2557542 RepID=A0A9W7KTB2_9STRA|nr:hypothetical protein TrRE_jg7517 [Triparma retinervis]